MGEQLSQSIVMAPSAKEQILGAVDSTLRSMRLLDRSAQVRRAVDLSLSSINVEAIPDYLGDGKRAILVSNYPSVYSAMNAVIKVSCRLPGQRFRLNAIARPEVVSGASVMLKALGIEHHVFPVQKDDAGVYRLDRRVLKDILAFLDEPDGILWMSITGSTRGNGLLEEDRRTGAAQFAVSKGIPLVPMALEYKEHKGKPRVVKVRFGEPIDPVGRIDMTDFEKSDYLNDLTRLAMCRIAQLLPPGQRADFENADEKYEETCRRLSAC